MTSAFSDGMQKTHWVSGNCDYYVVILLPNELMAPWIFTPKLVKAPATAIEIKAVATAYSESSRPASSCQKLFIRFINIEFVFIDKLLAELSPWSEAEEGNITQFSRAFPRLPDIGWDGQLAICYQKNSDAAAHLRCAAAGRPEAGFSLGDDLAFQAENRALDLRAQGGERRRHCDSDQGRAHGVFRQFETRFIVPKILYRIHCLAPLPNKLIGVVD
ncbi:MAG: hypothetical protein HOP19_08220 [Acidobacteria bacterium]|nr:hypothetical protein [Acidobacteriota bacterium]